MSVRVKYRGRKYVEVEEVGGRATSYPQLKDRILSAFADEDYHVRRRIEKQLKNKEKTLELGRRLGIEYDPPARFGTKSRVTHTTRRHQVVRDDQGRIIGTLDHPGVGESYEEKREMERYSREKKQAIETVQEDLKKRFSEEFEKKKKGPQQSAPSEIIRHTRKPAEKGTFEYAVLRQEERDRKAAERFQRIQETARVLTFGGSKSYTERSWVGKYSENLLSGAMSFPLAIGSTLASTGEKVYITVKFRDEIEKGAIKDELTRGLKDQRVRDSLNPTTPEGAAAWTVALIAGAARAAPKLRVTETPVKAHSVKIHKSVRQTKAGPKVDSQVQIHTIKGKAQVRNVFKKSRIKPEKSVHAKLSSKTKQNIKEFRHTETSGQVKAKLNLEKGKVKVKTVDYKETAGPKQVFDAATRYSGKTSTGTPVKGKTPSLRKQPGIASVKDIRVKSQHTVSSTRYKVNPKTGKLVKVSQRQHVKVKIGETTKTQLTQIQSYRNAPVKGKLLAESSLQGKFIDPAPKPAPVKISPFVAKPKGPPPSTVVKVLRSGKVKVFSVLESGKLVKFVGPKPKGAAAPAQTQQLVNVLKNLKKPKSQDFTPVIGAEVKAATPGPLVPLVTQSPGQVKTKAPAKSKTDNVVKLSTLTETREKLDPVTVSKRALRPAESKKVEPIFRIDQQQKDSQAQKPFSTSGQLPGQDVVPDQVQEPDIRPQQDIIPQLRQVPVPGDPIRPGEQPRPGRGVFVQLKKDLTDLDQTRQEQGYNVYMKELKKTVKANVKPLPLSEARRLGKDIADNSLSASFRVSKTDMKVPSARRSRLARGVEVSDKKFRKSKGWDIERSRHRLDSPGEKAGIRASKLIADRKRGLLKKIRWR